MKYTTLLFTVFISFCLYGCHTKQKEQIVAVGEKAIIKYAEGFTLEKCPDYNMITVLSPWKKGEIYDKYYLVKDSSIVVPNNGKKIIIPLNSIAVNSATHLEFLKLIGVTDKIRGICNAQYIYNPTVLEKVKEGKIADLGDAFNIDIERLMVLHPQAIMTSAYEAKDGNAQKMEQSGIPILFNIEWQEKTLLGRAEWIKFVAAFFDKFAMADSIFDYVEKEYNNSKQLAAGAKSSPNVLSGQDFRGTWSMPGGKSFNAQLFNDARGDYFYTTNEENGSLSETIESALINFGNTDIWVGVQANSLEELGKADSKYKLFKAFKNKNVYNYNNRTNSAGGNDYWEGAVAHPDLLLKDMIKAFHPELLPKYEFTYMQKLNEK